MLKLISIVMVLFFSLEAYGTDTPFCEVLNVDRDLIGVATRTGKIGRFIGEDSYRVEARSFPDDSIHLVSTWNRDYVLYKMGRSNQSGEIYDERDRKIGFLENGIIFNIADEKLGYYQGCDDLVYEIRNSLIGAAASRLLVFNFDHDYWEQRYFQYCEPQNGCRW